MCAHLSGSTSFVVNMPERDQDKKYTVFVVDDDIDDRAYAMKVLGRSPHVYNVHAFESGDRLMAHFAAHDFYNTPVMRNMPLLILLDRRMPGTDGLDILSALRGQPLTRDIPIIMLTADASAKTAADAQALNVNAFLSKPLRLESIHDVILNGRSWPMRGQQDGGN